MADGAFADVAKELLPTTELYEETLQKFETFVNYLTEHLDVWKEVSQVPAGIQHARLKQIRNRGYVCCKRPRITGASQGPIREIGP